MSTLIADALTAPLVALAPLPLLLYADTVVGQRRYALSRAYARLVAGVVVGTVKVLAAPFSGR